MVEGRRRTTPGAVWRAGVDRLKGLVPNPLEKRRRVILERFQEIGGNAPLESARVVCLGESHGWHNERKIGRFIRAFGERGDIVLVEGVQQMEQPAEATGIQEAYNFPSGITVLGWDDLALRDQAQLLKNRKNEIEIDRILARDNGDFDRLFALGREYLEINNRYNNIIIDQRNHSMYSTLQRVKEDYPDARVFIIAGARHFTDDQQLTTSLEQNKYIVLRPKMNEIAST